MNKKAQEKTLGSTITILFFASFLFIAGFMGYLSILDDNSVTMSEDVNISKIEATFAESKDLSNSVQNQSSTLPSFLDSFDFLSVGYDSIKSLFGAPALFGNIISFIRENSFFRWLPNEFWGTIIGIIVAIVTLIVLGAFWRYKFA